MLVDDNDTECTIECENPAEEPKLVIKHLEINGENTRITIINCKILKLNFKQRGKLSTVILKNSDVDDLDFDVEGAKILKLENSIITKSYGYKKFI